MSAFLLLRIRHRNSKQPRHFIDRHHIFRRIKLNAESSGTIDHNDCHNRRTAGVRQEVVPGWQRKPAANFVIGRAKPLAYR